MLIGYARVSTLDQDNELQLQALQRAGVERVYQEKRSAVKRRAELERMLMSLRVGDVVVVYKLDRLARSLRDLLEITDRIAVAGCSFRSLTEQIDTTTPTGELVFHVLGALGQFERSLIRERSMAGLEVARRAGKRLGRLPALDDHQSRRLAKLWEGGEFSKAELARKFGVSLSTVKRTLWRLGLDTISEAHAHGMLPPK